MRKILSDRFAISILAFGLLFRVIVALWLYPGYDEAYYYTYTHHLDWSFFDHPIMVALSTGLGTWLTGQVNQFTIRWGTLIFHTASLILLYLTALRLFSLPIARMSLVLATLIPVYSIVFGILTLPDSPLIFFWSLTVYLASVEFFPAGERPYRPTYRVALLGIAVGLTVLSKYHGFLLGIGLVLFCLTTPRYWRVFRSPWLLLAIIGFIVTLFPILYWNNQHDWISFRFHLGSRFSRERSTFSLFRVFLVFAISVATMCPTFGIPMWWVTLQTFGRQIPAFFSRKTFFHRDDRSLKQWLILCVSLPLILGFTYIGAYHHLAPSWILPGFWSCTILLGDRAVEWQKYSKKGVKRWIVGSGIAIVTLLALTLLHLNLGTFQKPSQYSLFGGLVPPEQDPSREVVDIAQLRQGFADSPELLSLLKNTGFVFTHSYYLAGWLDMALYPLVPVPIAPFTGDTRGFQIWTDPRDWIGKDGLLITTNVFAERPAEIDRYRPYFRKIEKVGAIPIKRGGVAIEQFHIYRATDLLRPFP
ncbi:glycosyltransferase family 39 protein [Pannus brasiliensis CCIBt3594]|uniref:Glycosyltransferase family 39 protein n=1 Tax=Pannus brasiliensis CCIBt3594 TaxID=1427578 RepID=A0AAW9QUF5_9CHRO